MNKHFCDICGKEQDWRRMVRIQATREGVNAVVNGIRVIVKYIDRHYELCGDCFERTFKPKKDEYEFPPQTVEAISGVSPV